MTFLCYTFLDVWNNKERFHMYDLSLLYLSLGMV